MDQTTLNKVEELQAAAQKWLKQYEAGSFAQDAALAGQAQEMKSTLDKCTQILAKAKGSSGDWQADFNHIKALFEKEAFFANCFGNAADLLAAGEKVDAAVQKLAGEAQKLASNWYGQFADLAEVPENLKATVAGLSDRAKQLLGSAQKPEGNYKIAFFGTQTGESRKLAKHLDDLVAEHAGQFSLEKHLDDGQEGLRKKHNIEHFPTLLFMVDNKEFARHEGEISLASLQQKINTMLEGAKFSDSSKVISMEDQKTISERELFELGEFVVVYFETVWSGACKKVGSSVKDAVLELAAEANKTTSIKYENVLIDGRTKLHERFKVDKVPTMVYLRDGNEVGRHEGYINPSNLKEDMRRFLANGKVGNSSSNEVDLIGMEYDQASAQQLNMDLKSRLDGSVGKGGKNETSDVYTIQVLLAQNGYNCAADGEYSNDLAALITEFQAANELPQTGAIKTGDESWLALNS